MVHLHICLNTNSTDTGTCVPWADSPAVTIGAGAGTSGSTGSGAAEVGRYPVCRRCRSGGTANAVTPNDVLASATGSSGLFITVALCGEGRVGDICD
jgi:hypothetical protein